MCPDKRETTDSWWRRNKLFDTTDISGLGLIHAANSKLEICMWYVIIGACAFVTIQNVVNLVSQYLEGETVTAMEIGRSDAALFPNMTFCIQLKLPEVNPEFQRSKAKNSLLQNVSTVMEDVQQALDKFNNKYEMLEKDWDYVLLPMIYRYFTAMRLLEVNPALLNPKTLKDEHARVLNSFLTNRTSPMISKTIFYLLESTRKLGVTDQELFEKLGEQLSKMAGFKIVYQERNLAKNTKFPIDHRLVLLGYKISENVVHKFCYKYMPIERMLKDRTKLVDIVPRIDFQMRLSGRDKLLKNAYGFTMERFLKSYGRQLEGKYGEEQVEKLDVYMGNEFGANQFMPYPVLTSQVSRTVRAHFATEAYYNMKTNCSLNQTKDECVLQCKTSIIQAACHCTPALRMATLDVTERHNLKLCTLSQYFAGCLNVTMVADYNRCIKQKCIPPCNHARYDMDTHTVRKYNNYPKSRIYIYREETEYPIFIEQDAQSFESFFGELGGTLDFYLGVSVIAIVHLIFYSVKQILYILGGGKKKEKSLKSNKTDEESVPLAETVEKRPKTPLPDNFEKRLARLEMRQAKMLTMLTSAKNRNEIQLPTSKFSDMNEDDILDIVDAKIKEEFDKRFRRSNSRHKR